MSRCDLRSQTQTEEDRERQQETERDRQTYRQRQTDRGTDTEVNRETETTDISVLLDYELRLSSTHSLFATPSQQTPHPQNPLPFSDEAASAAGAGD